MNMFEFNPIVSIRPITINDTDNIVKWRNSPAVKRYLYTQDELTPEQHIKYFNDVVKAGKCIQFIIVINENGNFEDIGTVFIKNIDIKNRKGEFGIFIGEESARGKGYSKIATKEILDYAFNIMCLNKVYLSVMEDNIPAIKAYKDVGFVQDGKLRDDYLRNGIFVDILIMSLLQNDWKRKNEKGL